VSCWVYICPDKHSKQRHYKPTSSRELALVQVPVTCWVYICPDKHSKQRHYKPTSSRELALGVDKSAGVLYSSPGVSPPYYSFSGTPGTLAVGAGPNRCSPAPVRRWAGPVCSDCRPTNGAYALQSRPPRRGMCLPAFVPAFCQFCRPQLLVLCCVPSYTAACWCGPL